jgi:DNA polymerase-3 subunit beta
MRAKRAAAKRSEWPILTHLHVAAADGKVTVTGFDLELGVECSVEAVVETPGEWMVEARILVDLVFRLQEKEIELWPVEGDAHSLEIRAMDEDYTHTYKLVGLDPKFRRALPTVEAVAEFSLPGQALHSALKRTLFAASEDHTRAIIAGVYFEYLPSAGSELVLVATDTHRLSVVRLDIPEVPAFTGILPRWMAAELLRVLPKDAVTVRVQPCGDGPGYMEFVWGGYRMVAKLVPGMYPDYRRVIPTKCAHRWQVDIRRFRSALERAWLVGRHNSGRVTLSTAGEVRSVSGFLTRELKISATSLDIGHAEEVLPTIVSSSEDFEAAYNVKYLQAFAELATGEDLTMEMKEPLLPALMRSYALPEGLRDWCYVLMPMQIV